MAFGENGLVKYAEEARDKTANSTIAEAEGINSMVDQFSNLISDEGSTSKPSEPDDQPTTVIEAIEDGTTFKKKTPIKDEKNNTIMIPAGFKIASDSGKTVQQGIVIEDVSASPDENVQGSQYVWIPVGTFIKDDDSMSQEIKLARYQYSGTTRNLVQDAANYTENIVISNSGVDYTEEATYDEGYEDGPNGRNATAKDLKGFIDSTKSIAEGGNGGYYIGRYEASYASGNSTENYKAASKVSTGKSTSSMNYEPGTLWNHIRQPAASKVAINTYSDSTSVKSDLINSYAWDTAIVYIQEAGHINYPIQNSKNFSLSDTGTNNDEVCKINDMASNIHEYTTEHSNGTHNGQAQPCVVRGGYYNYSGYGSVYREGYPANDFVNGSSVGFRINIYM